MAMFYVHICDKCGNRNEGRSASLPNFWTEANYYTERGADNPDDTSRITWCQQCSYDIFMKKPQNFIPPAQFTPKRPAAIEPMTPPEVNDYVTEARPAKDLEF